MAYFNGINGIPHENYVNFKFTLKHYLFALLIDVTSGCVYSLTKNKGSSQNISKGSLLAEVFRDFPQL